ncbi:hypothetical protein SRHO_G00325110 [Serrasalmus rhombeus]
MLNGGGGGEIELYLWEPNQFGSSAWAPLRAGTPVFVALPPVGLSFCCWPAAKHGAKCVEKVSGDCAGVWLSGGGLGLKARFQCAAVA